jgi:hypothetical protein
MVQGSSGFVFRFDLCNVFAYSLRCLCVSSGVDEPQIKYHWHRQTEETYETARQGSCYLDRTSKQAPPEYKPVVLPLEQSYLVSSMQAAIPPLLHTPAWCGAVPQPH